MVIPADANKGFVQVHRQVGQASNSIYRTVRGVWATARRRSTAPLWLTLYRC